MEKANNDDSKFTLEYIKEQYKKMKAGARSSWAPVADYGTVDMGVNTNNKTNKITIKTQITTKLEWLHRLLTMMERQTTGKATYMQSVDTSMARIHAGRRENAYHVLTACQSMCQNLNYPAM